MGLIKIIKHLPNFLLPAMSIKRKQHQNTLCVMPTIKPVAAGCEAIRLSLPLAAPLDLDNIWIVLNFNQSWVQSDEEIWILRFDANPLHQLFSWIELENNYKCADSQQCASVTFHLQCCRHDLEGKFNKKLRSRKNLAL